MTEDSATTRDQATRTSEDGEHQQRSPWIWRVLSALVTVIGLLLVCSGLWLTILGGPNYYLFTGAYIIAAVLLSRRESEAAWLAVTIFAATIWIQLQ